MRLGQAIQKQQRLRCPKHKMYLAIRGADDGALFRFVDNNQDEICHANSNSFHVMSDKNC